MEVQLTERIRKDFTGQEGDVVYTATVEGSLVTLRVSSPELGGAQVVVPYVILSSFLAFGQAVLAQTAA